ncbi:hypothetical protein CathTA2_2262 [Caldalkalibacillus thermarum TA2.A1]|uniref:Uncharacterized protein n=1 Tax=Caldalkalibacillus thermarum (strain TA2.A1) TaxID=986075 RepID=F5L8V7_CALTT|nr:hypothetical protein [Caldalkalibacillus thermarum]EGL82239.1 hypothetical protein CathTA2_2262 [Caldalkalibacillus thermarum TA2.A1]QZT32746.1 hypothetical protein HUR95_10155 [Caldalkalibacillus thermarum TA2.A1]
MRSEPLDRPTPPSFQDSWDAPYHPDLFEQTKKWYRPHAALEKNRREEMTYRHIFFPHHI